jgi:hypothetical protein
LTFVSPFQVREEFSEGLAIYGYHHKWGFIDTDGTKVIKAHYDWADNFSDQLACVRKGFKKGFIDHNGVFIIPPRFEDALSFSDELAAVKATPEEAAQSNFPTAREAKPEESKGTPGQTINETKSADSQEIKKVPLSNQPAEIQKEK